MRDVIEESSRRMRPVSIFAVAVTTLLSVAVSYNALLGQNGRGTLEIAGDVKGATRMQVALPGSGGNTIQLKYDPVVENVQRQLYASGYYKGSIDGVLGKKTRAAISAYQKSVGLEADGEPSNDLVEHIRFTREVSQASLFTGSTDKAQDADSRADIRRVQTGLAELAYSPGAITGEMSDDTRRAIRDFQHDRKLPETGEISPELMAELAKMSGQSGILSE